MRLPRWIAHRGGGALAPENTLAGIRLAARMGFRAVEFDVMLSADDSPFLIHDETLERTTNGRGEVCRTTDRELAALDAGAGERVPTLREAALLCRRLGLRANVEVKPARGQARQTAEVVARQAQTLWGDDPLPPLLSSFSLEALEICRDLAPELPRGVLFETLPDDWPDVVRHLGAVSVHCDATRLSAEQVAAVRRQGLPLCCYTVNAIAQAERLLAWGVSSLFTDRLDLFAADAAA
ncbi:glycerophosphodiester phosphodiesterase [uncultured Azonexus sp.]|uniref:glycerophosphodiester phosphodiesterase n=1 Tax=uncultured Azonexus sp. TaxID=520307 RepID=UPI002633785D|nr:glycerophosphodiester phosphodiesterase [uncultured Azonexus sp.]